MFIRWLLTVPNQTMNFIDLMIYDRAKQEARNLSTLRLLYTHKCNIIVVKYKNNSFSPAEMYTLKILYNSCSRLLLCSLIFFAIHNNATNEKIKSYTILQINLYMNSQSISFILNATPIVNETKVIPN